MMRRAAGFLALLAGLSLGGASSALAQCSVRWNGDEPFTHFSDLVRNADGSEGPDGLCDEAAEPAPTANATYDNGFYPHCVRPDQSIQTSHGHFEYTHLHTDAQGDTEEKDYLDTTNPGQTVRFAANEPERFRRAGDPSENPDRGFWQVDEWIAVTPDGQRVRFLTWNERFFECTGPLPCVILPGDGRNSSGGYWSDHRGSFCGDDPFTANGARNDACGMAFVQCVGPQ